MGEGPQAHSSIQQPQPQPAAPKELSDPGGHLSCAGGRWSRCRKSPKQAMETQHPYSAKRMGGGVQKKRSGLVRTGSEQQAQTWEAGRERWEGIKRLAS